MIDEYVDEIIAGTCAEIGKRHLIYFLKIGTDKAYITCQCKVYRKMNPAEIVGAVKSITAKEIFRKCSEARKKLWGEVFLPHVYYTGMTWIHENKKIISNCVKNQGKKYRKIYQGSPAKEQMNLSDYF